jgi:hypothetical protein
MKKYTVTSIDLLIKKKNDDGQCNNTNCNCYTNNNMIRRFNFIKE